MLIRKKTVASNGSGPDHFTDPGPETKDFPAIVEFVSSTRWEDGSKREKGTFSVFWEDGKWKAWVNDKDGERSACVSGFSVLDVVRAIEDGLVSDSLDWRPSPKRRDRRS